MAADPNQAKALFLEAVEKHAPDEWPAFLDRTCAGLPELRRRVEVLLAAHREAGTAEHPSAEDAAPVQGSGTESAAGPGTVVGPYKLVQEIGEGGMGTVWMAQQHAPVKRLVALKVIKPGMDSRQVVARFEAERQALALMDHPNIARVFDAGTTDAGRPYFVMELVKGVPITRYCDERRLTPKQRLELFVPVCQAVQHAHQKGVIHRDLKPSNVLVALYDGKPVPKVIDFGVAKATGQSLTEQTLVTGFGAVVGTLEYMSPEQAEINQLDVDTRSDVYSLGVLLYELLTGSTPLERRRLKQAALLEVLRIIREEEPPRPSTRLSESKDSLPAISAQRQTEPAKLTRLVRGELDWIVMKALEKDRARRYETANGFAQDVERYLADEPVLACPPSAGYRLRKFVRRNKGPVLAAALVFVALVAGVIGTTLGLLRAEEAREAEEQQRLAAEAAEAKEARQRRAAQAAEAREAKQRRVAVAEAELANAVKSFLEYDVLELADPATQLREGAALKYDADVRLRDVVLRAARKVEGKFTGRPLVEAEIRHTLGYALHGMGRPDLAAQQYERARELRRAELGPDHPDTLQSMNNLANCYRDLGRYADALELDKETLTRSKARLGPDDPHTLSSIHDLALSYEALGRHADALKLHQEALARMKARLGPDDPETLLSMSNLATCYRDLGRLADALKLHQEALARMKARLGPDHPNTLASMADLATTHARLGRHAEALKLREEALALMKARLGPDHPDTLASMNNLANSYWALGRFADACKLHQEVLALRRARLGSDHPLTLSSMHNLANCYQALGRLADALKLHQETLALRKARLGPDHPDTLESMACLAVCYKDLGRHADAVKLNEEALTRARAKLGPDHAVTLQSMNNLAVCYWELGRPADAFKLYQEVLARRMAKLGPDHPDTLNSEWRVIGCLVALGRGAEALPRIDALVARADRAAAAGKRPDPRLLPHMLAYRLQIHRQAGDAAGCRATAELWEKRKPRSAAELYNAACCRAVTAAVQAQSQGDDAARRAAEDAGRAMDWLRQAVAAGWADRALMEKDSDLDYLRGRADFRELLAHLKPSKN